MKIFLITLLAIFQAKSAEVQLSAGDAEALLKKIQACSTDKCWSDSLSSQTSILEKNRTRVWLKKFKIGEAQGWYPCNFKLRPPVVGEVCFAQPDSSDKDEEVRMIFQHDGTSWCLKHLSLPSPRVGW